MTLVGLVLLLASIGGGCSARPEPVKLIDGLESHLGIEEVRNVLKPSEGDWIVVEDSGLDKRDIRPSFDVLVVSVKNYSHLGFSGGLVLHFFNNKLVSTWFYPSNLEKYKDAFKKHFRAEFRPYTEINIDS